MYTNKQSLSPSLHSLWGNIIKVWLDTGNLKRRFGRNFDCSAHHLFLYPKLPSRIKTQTSSLYELRTAAGMELDDSAYRIVPRCSLYFINDYCGVQQGAGVLCLDPANEHSFIPIRYKCQILINKEGS